MNSEEKKIWQLLEQVPDPEIPVISIVELGVVRGIILNEEGVQITITPTYVGCPAVNQFQDDIVRKLQEHNYKNITIELTYSPAWTTKWISEEAQQKLLEYGIAPPKKEVFCPQCKSTETVLISEFGSTACKALYKCTSCLEVFHYFKCI
jgi:ring-1,2-phenylacetyl-CoA epoxidase subunit PaaD